MNLINKAHRYKNEIFMSAVVVVLGIVLIFLLYRLLNPPTLNEPTPSEKITQAIDTSETTNTIDTNFVVENTSVEDTTLVEEEPKPMVVKYKIQLAAFRDTTRVDKEKIMKLEVENKEIEFYRNNGGLYKVLLGEYLTKSEAKKNWELVKNSPSFPGAFLVIYQNEKWEKLED